MPPKSGMVCRRQWPMAVADKTRQNQQEEKGDYMKISVVIPVYGCKNSLNELYERLKKSLSFIQMEP